MSRIIKNIAFGIGIICVGIPLGVIYACGWVANKLTGGLFKNGLDLLSDLILKPSRTWGRLMEGREEKLYRALREGDFDRVKNLVSANINADGAKALQLATNASYAAPEITEYLLKSGIDPNCRDEFNNTALHNAIIDPYRKYRDDVLKALIDNGADPNLPNGEGQMPLHLAINGNEEKTIKILISKGADINIKSEGDNTLLHYAARWGVDRKVIAALVTAGVDIFAKTTDGKTAEDLANARGNAGNAQELRDSALIQNRLKKSAITPNPPIR